MPYRDFGQFGTYYYHQLLPKPMFDKYMAAGCDKDDSSNTCDQLMDQVHTQTYRTHTHTHTYIIYFYAYTHTPIPTLTHAHTHARTHAHRWAH